MISNNKEISLGQFLLVEDKEDILIICSYNPMISQRITKKDLIETIESEYGPHADW